MRDTTGFDVPIDDAAADVAEDDDGFADTSGEDWQEDDIDEILQRGID